MNELYDYRDLKNTVLRVCPMTVNIGLVINLCFAGKKSKKEKGNVFVML